MNGQYSVLAPFYDKFNESSFDYDRYADMFEHLLGQNGVQKGALLLDLACGTGKMTIRMLERGFDTIGVDLSPEMLGVCRDACAERGYSPLLLCQDMCSLDLYGTVEGAICALDSVNYLTEDGELEHFFKNLKNFISPGGIFLFDVNTKRKFSEVYAENCYTYDDDGAFCIWQNGFDEKTMLCDFDLTFFVKEKGGLYRRLEEHQRERSYTKEELYAAARLGNFEPVADFADTDLTPSDGSEMRTYHLFRRI